MTKIRNAKILLVVLTLFIGALFYGSSSIFATDEEQITEETHFSIIDEDGNVQLIEYETFEEPTETTQSPTLRSFSARTASSFSVVDEEEDGTVQYETSTYEDAATFAATLSDEGDYSILEGSKLRSANYAVARLSTYFNYTEVKADGNLGRAGYAHGQSASDAAYISTSSDGKTIRIKLAGQVMEVASSVVRLETYASNSEVSHYFIDSNGIMYHRFSYMSQNNTYWTSLRVGYAQSYMQVGSKYYSYDGHYFYDTYQKMIDDYRNLNSNYRNAINASSPYYNYYQYLSHRTQTTKTGSDLSNFISSNIDASRTSVLRNNGGLFINSQNSYGVNAALVFGVAINESAWGTSSYAVNRNNLFGHNAGDSNPDDAYSYSSVQASINGHAYSFLSSGYLFAADERYRGSHLGDKQSGLNVKYASDPYWGEKAASHLYRLDSNKTDYGKYTIGILKSGDQVFYNSPSYSTEMYYSSGALDNNDDQVYNVPVVILESVTNNEGQTWYKIQSDSAVNSNRNELAASSTIYNFSTDIVYVPASTVNVVSGNVPTVPPTNNDYILGDVSGNGKIDAADYLMIKDSIMKIITLTDEQRQRADVSGNGKVDAADYLMIKDHIMGIIQL